MSPFRRIIAYAKPYKGYGVLNILFNILYSLLSIVSVVSFLPILNILFGNKKQDFTPVVSNEFSFDNLKSSLYAYTHQSIEEYGGVTVLAWFCFITVALFLLRNTSRYMAQYFMVGLRSGVAMDIRNDLYKKVLALPVAYFTEQRKGDLMTRISSDVDNVQRYTLTSLIELVRSPFMLIASLSWLIFQNYKLTLAALLILPVMGFLISTISKSLRRNAKKAQDRLGNLLSFVEETLSANKIIKIFNAETLLGKRFNETNGQWRTLTNKVDRRYDLASPMSEFLGSLTMIGLVWFGGRLIFEGNSSLDGESFLVFIAIFFQMLDPAKMLAKSFSDISRGNASAERILQILDTDIVVNEKENAQEIHSFEHEIVFDNVSFGYHTDQSVIKEFNLTLKAGQTVALVGQSGSGKSTIANLLARFYDVSSGQILIDGVPLSDLKIGQYRSLIGMVTQESVLFNDTIFNNIALGNEYATLEQVQKAAEIANAHEFIEKLPQQYQESVGEGGAKLSGGQKQRLSIARAVMKNPPIMILDEATSALDTHSERLVQEALDKMMQNRTSLVIAHRLSTIQNADLIVVMDQGEIKEMGKHQELISKKGIYARLIEMQNFE